MTHAAAPKLAILAGGGVAPRQIIRTCQETGRPFIVVCLEGHADPDLGTGVPHVTLPMGGLQKFKDLCEREAVREIVMVGRVRRPSLSELKADWLTLKFIGKIGLSLLGDDGLLRGVAKVLEEECGVRLIGASQICTDMLTPAGVLTRRAPDAEALADIVLGQEEAAEIGRKDIGQAVLIRQGKVLGLEDSDGTAALIARCGKVNGDGIGVLVKMAKPQQDVRFDLPAVGPDTVKQMAEAGFAGIAVEAGRSLLLSRDETIKAADEAGLFIIGFVQEDVHA